MEVLVILKNYKNGDDSNNSENWVEMIGMIGHDWTWKIDFDFNCSSLIAAFSKGASEEPFLSHCCHVS